MKLLSTALLALLIVAGSAIAGCQKREPAPPNPTTTPSESPGTTGSMPSPPASAASR